jgi:hypothetical protein
MLRNMLRNMLQNMLHGLARARKINSPPWPKSSLCPRQGRETFSTKTTHPYLLLHPSEHDG